MSQVLESQVFRLVKVVLVKSLLERRVQLMLKKIKVMKLINKLKYLNQRSRNQRLKNFNKKKI
jgi:hypothetical protein